MISLTSVLGSAVEVSTQDIEAFSSGFRGQILTEVDAGYDEARAVWNGMIDRRPGLIVRPSGSAGVVAAVRFAREHGLVVAIKGGGHNVAGYGTCDGGLLVDLSAMNAVHVDPVRQVVRVQGGATLGDLDTEALAHGLSVPAGVISTTGVGGLILGGGTGWQTRKHGLSIDNLRSVEIVTADGNLRVASAEQNADLFWAVRGGGGNFGVVTWFEINAFPRGDVWINAPFYPLSEGPTVVRAFRDFMATAPREFGGCSLFWTVPAVAPFPEEHHGKRSVTPFLVYTGDPEEGERLTAPLRRLATPYIDLSHVVPWTGLQTMFDAFVPVRTQQYYWKNTFLKSADDEVVDEVLAVAASVPSPYTYLVLQPMGGALNEVPADATAFGNRDLNYIFELDSMWRDAAEAERNIAWTREQWDRMQKHSTGGLYINFPGFGEEGEQLVRQANGQANFDRLAHVKAVYDPQNMFRVNQNITPRAQEKP